MINKCIWILLILFDIMKFGFSQEQNKIFSIETRFCQFLNMASSGLKKMLILIIFLHMEVYQ